MRTLFALLIARTDRSVSVRRDDAIIGAAEGPALRAAERAGRSTGGNAWNRGSRRPDLFARAWNWLLSEQSRMHREMAAAVKDLKTGDPMRATGLLMLIAFLYGVLHAAGPGHGKAVISSYVLSNEETVKRGIALSFLAALFQALSAIFFVGVFAMLFNRTSLEMRATETLLETLSWGLVALVGAVDALSPVPRHVAERAAADARARSCS